MNVAALVLGALLVFLLGAAAGVLVLARVLRRNGWRLVLRVDEGRP